jgi:hypothetical protein
VDEEQLSDRDERFLNRTAELFFLLLLVAGAAIYVGYNVLYGAWFDIGIYSVTIPFILFGLGGLALNALKRKEEGRASSD